MRHLSKYFVGLLVLALMLSAGPYYDLLRTACVDDSTRCPIYAASPAGRRFSALLPRQLTTFLQSDGSAESRSTDADGFDDLTEREREVLVLIAERKRNQDITQQLHISGKTVSNHISNIFNKLQVAD